MQARCVHVCGTSPPYHRPPHSAGLGIHTLLWCCSVRFRLSRCSIQFFVCSWRSAPIARAFAWCSWPWRRDRQRPFLGASAACSRRALVDWLAVLVRPKLLATTQNPSSVIGGGEVNQFGFACFLNMTCTCHLLYPAAVGVLGYVGANQNLEDRDLCVADSALGYQGK